MKLEFGLLLLFGVFLLLLSKYALLQDISFRSREVVDDPIPASNSRIKLPPPSSSLSTFTTVKSSLQRGRSGSGGGSGIRKENEKEMNEHVNKRLPRCKPERTCTVSFPSSCKLYNRLIKYWDEDADCFTSPLRKSSGLQNPNIEERRYVVMQPDLGGWNNIRMALELGILFALVTGRIFVLPPPAVFYLLHGNKKWKDNFATYSDYLDFDRLTEFDGLEVITMKEFLQTVAAPGLLAKPLPDNNTDLVKKPLWDYLESACYVRQWSPGKIFIGFNITSTINSQGTEVPVFGSFDKVSKERWRIMKMDKVDRQMVPYDESFHKQRAIYFPGHDKNRMLTHFYTFMFFAEPEMEKLMKRFVRDRMRYSDEVYCAAGRVVELLYKSMHTDAETVKSEPQYYACEP
jgi:hypothetical protein